mmetsp:Transcript_13547/g.25937  ORF Transcript_13547/g.25937 Transcript_13547/m.25937 type:complete len:638 (-) Transcript_13547:339-2252(-)
MVASLELENGSEKTSAPPHAATVTAGDVGDYSPEGCLEKGMHAALKRCLTPQCFTAVLMVYSIVMSALANGLFASSASSIQRSLGLSSLNWGLVASMYDVYIVVLLLFMSYYGGRSHIPRFLGVTLTFFAVGCFLFTVPHFAFYDQGRALASNEGKEMCDLTGSQEEECSTSGGTNVSLAMFIFMLAQFCVSIGASAFWILAPIYLDRNVSQQKMNVYLAVLYSGGTIGPAVGYLMNGKLLDNWIDPRDPPPPGLTPSSSMWMGNWWMGYMIMGGISFLFLLPLACFPRFLPNTTEVRKAKLHSNELVINHTPDDQTEFHIASRHSERNKSRMENAIGYSRKDMRTFARACKDILTPMRIFNFLAHATETFAVSALSTFMPAIIESQFGLSPAQTSIVFGLTIVLGATAGIAGGGWFCAWRKYDGVQTARFCMIAAGISVPFCLAFLLMGCEKPGENVSSLMLDNVRNLDAIIQSESGALDGLLNETCNAGCGCNEKAGDLVCINGQTFYNMCYAGCSMEANESQFDLGSIRCSCVIDAEQSITPGYCKDPKNCTKSLIPFLILLFLLMFFTFMNNVPGSQVRFLLLIFFIFPFTSNAQTNNCFLIHFSFHQVWVLQATCTRQGFSVHAKCVNTRPG